MVNGCTVTPLFDALGRFHASVTLAQLAEHRLLSMPVGTGLRAVLDGAAATRGVRLHVSLQAAAADAIADLAAQGLGVGILSTSMAASYQDRLHALPISDNPVSAVLALVWRPDPTAAVREMVAQCRKSLSSAT
ncbi:substrate-binding domain-containing protein [Rhodococcus sp. X156]|uniref:substrate-binding domain-containing protein n=1 Tax=Rhodococcus sp. X156 TaxID=2499145 RepID=UPI000FDB85FA|nr:substrate-binding domain-containing protein [Rhodococcus sp. X156]